jgi:hypothetical protein
MCLRAVCGQVVFAGGGALAVIGGGDWKGTPKDKVRRKRTMSEEDEMLEMVTSSSTSGGFALRTQIDEVSYESLDVNDEILIQTANSQYRFSVLDPAHYRGRLSGGSLGHQSYDVTFAGSVLEEMGRDLSEVSKLRTNTRALFYLESPTGLKRMVTSRITSLFVLKGESL